MIRSQVGYRYIANISRIVNNIIFLVPSSDHHRVFGQLLSQLAWKFRQFFWSAQFPSLFFVPHPRRLWDWAQTISSHGVSRPDSWVFSFFAENAQQRWGVKSVEKVPFWFFADWLQVRQRLLYNLESRPIFGSCKDSSPALVFLLTKFSAFTKSNLRWPMVMRVEFPRHMLVKG